MRRWQRLCSFGRRPALRLFALLAIALAWVAPGQAVGGGRSVTDSAGRHVELPDTVKRVFAAGPPAAVLIYTLAPDKLVGWPRKLAPEAADYIPVEYAALPVVGRLTGHENAAGVAAVLAAHPDIIVDVGDVEPEYVELAERVQKESGIPYVLIDGSLAKTADSYRALGEILGEPARAAELAGYADGLLSDVQGKLASAAPVRAYIGRGKDGLETALAGSINAEALAVAGAVNVAAAAGSGELTKVTVAQVGAWNPDVIIALDPAFFAAATTDPQWRALGAVAAHRVLLAPAAPFGWIDSPPSANRLIGVRWLAARLHPEAFPGDLRDMARDFYARFYHRAPSETQLDALLHVATQASP